MSITLGSFWAYAGRSDPPGRSAIAYAGTPNASLDLFASRRTLQFVARVRSWQFHISTVTGIYLWPTNRHHLPRWGLIRRSTRDLS